MKTSEKKAFRFDQQAALAAIRRSLGRRQYDAEHVLSGAWILWVERGYHPQAACRIAVRQYYRELRRQRRRVDLVAVRAARFASTQAVRQAWAASRLDVPPEYRSLARLLVAGYTKGEAAAKLGLSVWQVSRRISRLREWFQNN